MQDQFKCPLESEIAKYTKVDTYSGGKVDAAFVLLLEADVGRLLVQSDAKALQLVFY